MSGFRQPEQPREQMVLWAQRLDDAIGWDHPVRRFDELLHSALFAETFREWESDYILSAGQPPYHPRDLAGLYLYGLLNRLRSSRQLEAACYNRLDVIWLMQRQHPDHSTMAEFVRRHGARLRQLSRTAIQVGVRAELIKLEHVAEDGTKIEAEAGRKSVRSQEKIRSWLSHLDEKIAALEAEWQENERQEAHLFGDQTPWSPSGSVNERQQLAAMKRQQRRLKRALAEIERRREESAAASKVPKAIASTTDPDARVMKDKEGRRKPNYNAQMAVDEASSMIVAGDVNDAAQDSGQMTPLLEQVGENCGQKPQAVSADSSYNTGPELAELEKQGITGYLPDVGVSGDGAQPSDEAQQALQAARNGQPLNEEQWSVLPRGKGQVISRVAFSYDAARDAYRCPAGHWLSLVTRNSGQRKWGLAVRRRYANPVACAACPQVSACCPPAAKGKKKPAAPRYRTIERDQYEEYRERMRARMESEAGRQMYRRRRETVEPRFGEIKSVLGVRRFLHRGLELVRTEWALVCTAVNVGILLRHWDQVAAAL
jgi:transposase